MNHAKQNLTALFTANTAPERLAKRIAGAGLCSRRQAELWIGEGRVKINGALQTSPAINVSASDRISVDDKVLPQIAPPRLWRYYKPRGLIVSHRDEKNRATIFDAIREKYSDTLPRLISVGRLDLDSEGLLLLTNSGVLARYLELPSTGWTRKYRVRVRGQVQAEHLKALGQGITIDGIRYRPVIASLDHQSTSNAWISLALSEGKNREIRNLMRHFGYEVSRLIRTSFGPFTLARLEESTMLEVKPAILRDQLGFNTSEAKHANHKRKKTPGKTHRPA